MSDKISVCMATYNGEKYIKEQVDSIIKQLGPDDEIIVSDDGSKDSTLSILKGFNDNRIKILHHVSEGANSFERATNNFENALTNATGDTIFLSDQDDIWSDNKVRIMLEGLEKNLIVQCQLLPFYTGKRNECRLRIVKQNGFLPNLYMLPFVGCCLAFKSSLLKAILPFPKGIVAHDAWIGMVGVASGHYSFLENKSQLYRLHDDNVSGVSKSTNSFLFKLRYRWVILVNLIKRFVILKNIRYAEKGGQEFKERFD